MSASEDPVARAATPGPAPGGAPAAVAAAPLVSILIPTLNRKCFLAEAVASALAQTHRAVEVVVSDDGSRDGSRELVQEIAAKDPRVRLLTDNPTPGIFTNMNHLRLAARGEFFCLLGDDDRLDPTFVSRLLEPLAKDPSIVASFGDHRIVDASGAVLEEATRENSARYGRAGLAPGVLADPFTPILEQAMCLGFSLYRSSVFEREAFDLECAGAADLDYAIRAARLGKLAYVAAHVGDYRVHPGTATNAVVTGSKLLRGSRGTLRVLEKHRFEDPRHEARRRELLRVWSRHLAFHACADDRRESLRSVGRFLALGGSPFDVKIGAALALALTPRFLARRVQRWILEKRRGT